MSRSPATGTDESDGPPFPAAARTDERSSRLGVRFVRRGRGHPRVVPDAIVAGVRGPVDEVLSVLSKSSRCGFQSLRSPAWTPRSQAHAAALLEWLEIPFTGSRSKPWRACRRKDRANAALLAAGVRCRDREFSVHRQALRRAQFGWSRPRFRLRDAVAVAAAVARWDVRRSCRVSAWT